MINGSAIIIRRGGTERTMQPRAFPGQTENLTIDEKIDRWIVR